MTIAKTELSEQAIESRIARFKDVMTKRGSFGGAVDSHLPRHRKKLYPVMGRNVSSGAAAAAPLVPEGGFSINFMQCAPGNYPALHSHDTLEVFIPITGRWKILFEQDGKRVETIAEPYDIISCPINMMRTLENISDGPAIVMAVIGMDETGRAGVNFTPELLAEVARAGAKWDDRYILTEGPAVSETEDWKP